MLKFDNAKSLQAFLDTVNSIRNELGSNFNYLHDVLLPAIKKGDWLQLQEMIIYQDEIITIRFGEDKWAFKNSNFKGKSVDNIIFSIKGSLPKDVIRIKDGERALINQIKCAALLKMYFSPDEIVLATLKNNVIKLRNNAMEMLKRNIFSFELITVDIVREWIEDEVDLSDDGVFVGLNMLTHVSGHLPFKLNYRQISHDDLGVTKADTQQHPVIPPRIYFSFLKQFSEHIVAAYRVRDEIEKAVEDMLAIQESFIKRKINGLRNGKRILTCTDKKNASVCNFIAALDHEGVNLVDNESDERWMRLYKEHKPSFGMSGHLNQQTIHIGDKSYLWGEFRTYLSNLSNMAAWLCLALSGMRLDELFSMHTNFGAQIMRFDKEGNDSELETVYLLTTRQSKITMNSQKKDDVYVTTIIGYKAFYVLNAIHEPIRSRLSDSDRYCMFTNLTSIQHPSTVTKAAISQTLTSFFGSVDGIDLTLTREDVDYLNSSEKKHSFLPGGVYHATPHQCRRSLAYYLIGYELCSFPALKQQLGHFSMAMTRWYARNATSYSKFWNEVNDERVKQQAEIYVRIFNRMANGERVAGGKGKMFLNTIAKSRDSYFEDGVNKRLLTTQYWEEMLRNKKEHLHAIAPSMYCTNDSCSMRIAIDLTECVNCEFDYIENVVYAESSRMDAMRNLNLLIEMNDLNASSATRCYMQIKSAERIMTDLDFDYEPYVFTEDVKAMVIVVKEDA